MGQWEMVGARELDKTGGMGQWNLIKEMVGVRILLHAVLVIQSQQRAARFNPVRSALDKWIPSVVLYKSLLHRADASNQ
uniref:Uncharacterized protein n=1 Tax=Oryza rufipogon TaxID=4529 RepID=A0A0E0Q6X1_ORYRU